MTNKSNQWSETLQKGLPYFALVAPISWFIGSIIWTSGLGHLPGDLFWVSGIEGFIMTLSAPFFSATFIYIGQFIARQFPKAGVWVTILGMLGVCPLCAISSFRLFITVFVEHGIDPGLISKAFNAESNYYLPFLILQLGTFASFILAGITILRMRNSPKWAGILIVVSIPILVTGQFLLFHTEVFWPLATGCWTLGLVGLFQHSKRIKENS